MLTARSVEKITVVVVVVILGAALAVTVRGAPVALLLLALVVTASAGMDLVLRGEARYHPTPDLFILPSAVVVGGVLFISLLSGGASIVIGLAVLAALLFAVFLAELARIGAATTGSTRQAAELVLAVTGYVAAFVLYAAVYQARTRSLLSAPAIIAITFALAARQLRLAHAPPAADEEPMVPGWPRTLMYSAAVALAAGEITWALNYWPLHGLLGGAFLLAAFYFLIGVFSQHLVQRLTVRLVAEYGAVAAVGMLLVTAAGLLRRGG
jgi:hypothetical protein